MKIPGACSCELEQNRPHKSLKCGRGVRSIPPGLVTGVRFAALREFSVTIYKIYFGGC